MDENSNTALEIQAEFSPRRLVVFSMFVQTSPTNPTGTYLALSPDERFSRPMNRLCQQVCPRWSCNKSQGIEGVTNGENSPSLWPTMSSVTITSW